MGWYTELQTREAKAAIPPTFGDYARQFGAGMFDLAGSVPHAGAYVASQFDSQLATDLEEAGNRLGYAISGLGDSITSYNTEAAQNLAAAEIGSEEFWNHPWAWIGMQGTRAAAPTVAAIASTLFTGPTVGLALNAGVAGVQSA